MIAMTRDGRRLRLRAPAPVVRAASVTFVLVALLGFTPADAQDRELRVCSDPSNLPFSNDKLEGFENRIAALAGKDLRASVTYTWQQQRLGFLRRTLQSGACDVVMGVPAELDSISATRPYYRSTYVFVTERSRDLQLRSFDDPALRTLRIGLHAVGTGGANTPAAMALAHRGIVKNVVGYSMWDEESGPNPPGRPIDDVAAGSIDVAIVWGPFGGYFAKAHGVQLAVTPVEADSELPDYEFSYGISMGVRKGDEALRSDMQNFLDRRCDEIEAILVEFGVPLVKRPPDSVPHH